MSALSSELIWFIPVPVMVAGFIGSPHCVAMCGPLVMNFANTRKRLAIYQLGRGLSYMLAGAMAGAVGHSTLMPIIPNWISSLTIVLIALLLIYNGLNTWLGHSPHVQLPRSLSKILTNATQLVWKNTKLKSRGPKSLSTTLLAGAMTVFLPCGHLFTFLIGAMATGSAFKGALFMTAFWIGTVPALGLGAGILGRWLNFNSAAQAKSAGAMLMAAGLLSLGAFYWQPTPHLASTASEPPVAGHQPATPGSKLQCNGH